MDFTLDLGAGERAQRGAASSSTPPPTALSLTWGLDEYADLLSEASKKI